MGFIYARKSFIFVLACALIFISWIPCKNCFHLRLKTAKIHHDTRSYLLTEGNEKDAAVGQLQQNQLSLEINRLLEGMPLAEKYSLLLQSYSSKLLEESPKNKESLEQIENLYLEMLANNIPPDIRSSESFINAAASFCDIERITRCIRILRKGGRLGGFGGINGQLTTPIISQVDSKILEIQVPTDNREKEVTLALSLLATLLGWIITQILSIFSQELHPISTLYSCISLLIIVWDAVQRKGQNLKAAVLGIERLVLRDDARQAHVDGAGFLAGYLLGLPCYCYKPDIAEILKMVDEFPESLMTYKQSYVKLGFDKKVDEGKRMESIEGMLEKLKEKMFDRTAISSSQSSGSSKGSTILVNEQTTKQVAAKLEDMKNEINSRVAAMTSDSRMFNLGRILVWLMAPVAAEHLKYGQTIVADPRRAKQLLQELSKEPGTNSEKDSIRINAPKDENDQEAFIQWAYFEATVLIRQYGDLLEEISAFLRTGSTSVGECTLLAENKLSG